VGLRGYWSGPEILDWMKAQGIKSHFMVEIDRAGFDVVMDRAIDQALDGPEYLFISLDIDVMDPSVAPGTASPEPGGMMSDQLLPMMRRVAHEVGICGIDVTEVSSPFDAGAGITAILANRAITEALTGLAMRKLDITGPDYIHRTQQVNHRRGTLPHRSSLGQEGRTQSASNRRFWLLVRSTYTSGSLGPVLQSRSLASPRDDFRVPILRQGANLLLS
jgi:hypothetical protein